MDIAPAGYLKLLDAYADDREAARTLANWLVNVDIPLFRDEPSFAARDRSKLYAAVLKLLNANALSSTNAKELIQACLSMPELPQAIEAYAEANGLLQQSDSDELSRVVDEVIAANPKAVSDVMNGELKVIGFLLGQVMAKTKGQANPGMAKQILEAKLLK